MSDTLKTALIAAVVAGERLRRIAIIDDDFHEVMHSFDNALRTARQAIDQGVADSTCVLDPIGEVLVAVRAELDRSTAKFPTWPTDPVHASAVVQEESGELAKAVMEAVYETHKATPEDACTEAIQTAAVAVRFLLSMDRYAWRPCEQHTQRNRHGAQGGEP